MRKSEIIISSIVLIALVMKLLMMAGADFVLLFSLTTLSAYYFLFGLPITLGVPVKMALRGGSYKGISALALIGGFAMGWSLASILIGILFKLLFLPGATFMLFVGLLLSFVNLLVVLVKYIRSADAYLQKAIARLAIIGSLGLFFYLTPQEGLVDILYFRNPEYARLYKEYLQDPDNKEIKEKMDQIKFEHSN